MFHNAYASVVRSLNFGEQFVGFPPWGANIDFALHIMAEGYKNVKSKGISRGTYHIGNDNNWSTSNTSNPVDDMVTAWKKFSREELQNLAWCHSGLSTAQKYVTCYQLRQMVSTCIKRHKSDGACIRQ